MPKSMGYVATRRGEDEVATFVLVQDDRVHVYTGDAGGGDAQPHPMTPEQARDLAAKLMLGASEAEKPKVA